VICIFTITVRNTLIINFITIIIITDLSIIIYTLTINIGIITINNINIIWYFSLGNALGPILGSILYAYGTDLPGPVDGRLVFIVGAAILMILATIGKIRLKD
jgi:hypothetical protein